MTHTFLHRVAALGAAAALSLGLAGHAQASGRAEVSYAPTESFTDAGFGVREIERTQRLLTAHLERLARQLPDGQVLKVQVRDIDLAGELDTLAFDRVRVMGRLPDRPRLDLHFELSADGGVLRHGDVVLTDLAYLGRSVGVRRGEPLEYERRLLDDWFRDALAPAAASAN